MLNTFKKQQLCYDKLFKFDMLPAEYNRENGWLEANLLLQMCNYNYDGSKATNISLP